MGKGPARDPVTDQTPDLLAEQLAALRKLMPQIFSEGKVDSAKLKEALGDATDDRPERYSFTWAGKRDAIKLLQAPSRATLIPTPDESVNWDTTKHVFVEGENLEVLKLLYRAYHNRVKLIYIDPPYNTGNDFIYPDDFADPLARYLQLTGQADREGNLLTSNPETSGRYHSAWLSMMYPRLFIARQLLRNDGLIFVNIDDTEVHNLRLLLNEVFGEENFVANVVWQKRYVSNMTAKFLSDMHDHILIYGRDIQSVEVQKLERTEEQLAAYQNPDDDPRGPWRAQDLSASKYYKAGQFTITTPAGLKADPPPGRYWRCNPEQYKAWFDDNRIWFGKEGTARPMLKVFLSDASDGVTPNTWWPHDFAGHNKEATLEVKALFDGAAPFDTSKPVKLLRRVIDLATNAGDLIVDFFSGSATAGHAVLQADYEAGSNRRFVLVQFPEPVPEDSNAGRLKLNTIADVGKERLRRVISRLCDDKKEKLDLDHGSPDLGFRVFKLAESHYRRWRGVPDKDPDTLHAAMAEQLDPLLPGFRPLDVVWEVAIKEGFSLSSQVEKMTGVNDNTVYRVTDEDQERCFLICLDDAFGPTTAKALNLGEKDTLVVRDKALDDTLAANLALQCRLKTV